MNPCVLLKELNVSRHNIYLSGNEEQNKRLNALLVVLLSGALEIHGVHMSAR